MIALRGTRQKRCRGFLFLAFAANDCVPSFAGKEQNMPIIALISDCPGKITIVGHIVQRPKRREHNNYFSKRTRERSIAGRMPSIRLFKRSSASIRTDHVNPLQALTLLLMLLMSLLVNPLLLLLLLLYFAIAVADATDPEL